MWKIGERRDLKPAKGEEHYESILNEDAVREIRKLWPKVNATKLGARFGVHESTVRCAAKRRSWKHVQP